MKPIVCLLALASSLGCNGSPAQENPNGNGRDNPVPGSLVADGATDTYQLIRERGYNYEVPDESGAHASAPFRHIAQAWDADLGKYVFEFILHIDNDDDRGLPNITDRQRNEIKTDDRSPTNMVAAQGETHTYTWKFRLPEGFRPTKNFTHIHQLKGYGGSDIDTPLITLTVRKKSSGKEYMQVIYTHPKTAGGNTEYLVEVPLADFPGQWVEVTEKACYSPQGAYSITIKRVADGKTLLDIPTRPLDLWRSGATGVRPKYGIYRSFGKDGELKPEMRDETLRFADFTLTEE